MSNRQQQHKLTAHKYFQFMREFKKRCKLGEPFAVNKILQEMGVNRNIIPVLKNLGYIQTNGPRGSSSWKWTGPAINRNLGESVREEVAIFIRERVHERKAKKKEKPKSQPNKKKSEAKKAQAEKPKSDKRPYVKKETLIQEHDIREVTLEDIYQEIENIKKFLRITFTE